MITAERDALIEEISAATGLGGRIRRAGSSAERATVAVTKAIAAAVARVADVDPALGRYLRDTVRTGVSSATTPTRRGGSGGYFGGSG